MKKILYSIGLSLVVLTLLFSVAGCQGDQGPIGPQGDQGIQGATGAVGQQGARGFAGEDGEDGISITWMGTATSAPKSWRVLNYAYYNSYKGKSYIWDGNSWEIWARDGATGATGASGAKGATGAAGAKGDTGLQGLVGEIVATSSLYGPISPGYKAAAPVDSVVLGEGDWMIVASGAIEVCGAAMTLNVGLRTGDGDDMAMIAKANIAPKNYTGRLGFCVVGMLSVEALTTAKVDLVYYGGDSPGPFEWNIVAIGGMAP